MIPDDIEQIVEQSKIENWYESVKEFTIPTWFIPLSSTQMEAMINQYNQYVNNQDFAISDESELQKLVNTIQDLVGTILKDGAFVRLSTRSPKDSKIALHKGKVALEKHIQGLKDENQKTIFQLESHKNALRSRSGIEALELLCSSERVYDDLCDALEEGHSQQLIIREWREMKLENEVRGFVFDNKLNALTQYFHYCYFPDLEKKREEINARIKALFNDFKDKVEMDNYVIDFVVTDDECYFVEFNPFIFGAAEPGLFSWKTDFEQLKYGPFEFRIRDRPL